MTVGDIIRTIEAAVPAELQETWDNTGLQVGSPLAECTGVLVSVDVTPAVLDEALRLGVNMIVSHHPLIFKGLKRLTGATQVEAVVMNAIAAGVSVYSCHTSVDNLPGGVSWRMAEMLGVSQLQVLVPAKPHTACVPDDARSDSRDGATRECGLGVVGVLDPPMTPAEFVRLVGCVFDTPVVRHSPIDASMAPDGRIRRVAMCGGSGGEFIPAAVQARAQAYLTADVRYHDFVDHGSEILIADIGHQDSERCTKDIFYEIITNKFANFAVYKSTAEVNPIQYTVTACKTGQPTD